MPLDEPSRRLAFLLQRDLRRLAEADRARASRGEEVQYDSVARMATRETRQGEVLGRWYGEVVATFEPAERILRWAWAGRSGGAHAEVIFREGQARNVPQLTMSVVGDLDEEEATALVRMGVLVAHGEGLQVRRGPSELTFVGMFDVPRPGELRSARYSFPPPPVARSPQPPAIETPPPVSQKLFEDAATTFGRGASPAPATPFRSIPPVKPKAAEPERQTTSSEAPGPPPSPPRAREPAKSVFLPVATAALSNLTKQSAGFQQGLFVLGLHEVPSGAAERQRLVVTLVAIDAGGTLRALDPALDLVETSARMIEAERAAGSPPWRKLTARITPKPDGGATFNVDVL